MMFVDYNLLGRRIATLRRLKGLTQEQLAERADVTNNYISHIENCARSRALRRSSSCAALWR